MLIPCHCTQMAHVERVLQLEEAERRQREAAHAAALRRQEDAVTLPPHLLPPSLFTPARPAFAGSFRSRRKGGWSRRKGPDRARRPIPP